ncbi:bile acid:sodium symporter family protein [Clostridium sp.]|uniref:bile acid:sodium symporter family protein n=1 Tax=Clostridium sp. TaxID=1506 RepID=UPI003464DE34
MNLKKLKVVENNLLPLVIITTVIALLLPSLGDKLKSTVSPMLALLMFFISLTFDFTQVKESVKKVPIILLTMFLVFIPMTLIGFLIGNIFFSGDLAVGQTILGALPTDVSAPLLVYFGSGNVALASIMNALVTGLSPLIIPPLLMMITGIEFHIPVSSMVLELMIIIILPTIVGVFIRSKFKKAEEYEDIYSFASSILYLCLLFVVVSDSGEIIKSFSISKILLIILACLLLNMSGYLIAFLTKPLNKNREDLIAVLFTVSKKEFSIAAAIVYTANLSETMLIPATFYAVIQMITSPLMVKLLNSLNKKGLK